MPPTACRPSRGLYLITPDDSDDQRLLTRTAALLADGVRLLQYRNKRAAAAQQRQQATQLRDLCRRHAVAFLVNDDADLAQALGAGVHLGEDDGDPRAVRARLGADTLIGVSCYDSRQRAEDAIRAGASYIALGAFFPTRSKQTSRRADLALLRDVASLGTPVVAIGGISPDNAGPLVAAGAHWVAAIDSVYAASDPAAAVRRFAALFPSPSAQDSPP